MVKCNKKRKKDLHRKKEQRWQKNKQAPGSSWHETVFVQYNNFTLGLDLSSGFDILLDTLGKGVGLSGKS